MKVSLKQFLKRSIVARLFLSLIYLNLAIGIGAEAFALLSPFQVATSARINLDNISVIDE